MIPKTKITRTHILSAMKAIDGAGSPPKRGLRKGGYGVVRRGKLYPPKLVVQLAVKLATGKNVKSDTFNGGRETNHFLESLGFTLKPVRTRDLKAQEVKREKLEARALRAA